MTKLKPKNFFVKKPDLVIEEKKPKTLPEQVKDINEKLDTLMKLDKKGKVKSFKIKRRHKAAIKKTIKRNKLAVFVKGENKVANVQVVDINSGYFVLNGVPRRVHEHKIFLWDGKYPSVFLDEWKIEPDGTKDFSANMSDEMVAKFIYAVAKSDANLAKKPMNRSALVWIIIGVLVGAYVLFGQN